MKLRNIIIIGVSFILIGIYISTSTGWELFFQNIKKIPIAYMCIAGTLMIIYWAVESLILHKVLKKSGEKISYLHCVRVVMIGQFFNNVTPFASGGQPAQLYALNKYDISLGKGTSVLVVKFIYYQFALVALSLLFLITQYGFYASKLKSFSVTFFIGFIINMSIIGAIYLFASHGKTAHVITKFIINIAHVFGYKKSVEEVEEDAYQKSSEIVHSMRELKMKTSEKIELGILSAFQILCFLSIPYFLLLPFLSVNYFNIIAGSSFLMMVTSFIPLPGASLGAEGGFAIIFGLFVSKHNVNTVMVLWRTLTFYSCILLGSFFLIKYKKRGKVQTLR